MSVRRCAETIKIISYTIYDLSLIYDIVRLRVKFESGGSGLRSSRARAPSRIGEGVINRPAPLVDEVYEAILDRVMSLAIPPGSKISVDSLSRELGVSQTPIREALSRLEAEGLVFKTHLVGYSAAPQQSREAIEQLFELRLLLEPTAAAKAATRLVPEQLERLRRLHERMSGNDGNEFPAYGQFARRDAEFHAIVAAASGNVVLAETLAKLHAHVHIFRLVLHARVTSEAIFEHAALLDALERRDVEASHAAMKLHVETSLARVLSLRR